jgi:hypothetical protein
VTEPTSDALFGFDGTQLPRSLPDPSGRDGWQDAPELPPITLPAFPDSSVLREAIAAALGDDPTKPVDQDLPAAPLTPAATPPDVPQADTPRGHITAPLPVQSVPPGQFARSPGGPPRASGPSQHPPPIVPAPIQPAEPPQRQRGGLGYRPALAAVARTPVQLGELRRRRIGRQTLRLPRQSRSDGGASAFFAIASILFVVLTISIVVGIVQALSRLLP